LSSALAFALVAHRVGIEQPRHHAKTGKVLKSKAIETNTQPYWVDYYLEKLDTQRAEILGIAVIPVNKKRGDDDQINLPLVC
jgi:hypothetical protein